MVMLAESNVQAIDITFSRFTVGIFRGQDQG